MSQTHTKKIILSLMLAASVAGISAAQAHGASAPLLGALVSLGNHGSIANVGAVVGNRNGLADVQLNVLNGAVKANVGVDQASHHSNSLLGVSATVLDGGVGHRSGW